MKCIAILESGNYVYKLNSELEKKGYNFEVVSTPCSIAKGGCGLCLKFPEEFLNVVQAEAVNISTPVKELYRIVPGFSKNKYERLY
ncbi:MAG TPA: DUF3343 domain-containing protein [Ruminiclostridium sp.]|nr:DUF3343 domain-containing protein [Ruminiclostridium sp.]